MMVRMSRSPSLLGCAAVLLFCACASTEDPPGSMADLASASGDGSGPADQGGAVPPDGGCVEAIPGPPAAAPYPFTLEGQAAWSHDGGATAGFFHTYDALRVGGASDKPHKVHVLLPRDYRRCGAPYPVVFMNDGQSVFFGASQGAPTWRVPEVLAGLYGDPTFPRVIVVGVVPVDRDYEYSHTPVGPDRACCGAAQYATYVGDHVRGFIARAYHARTDPAGTAIIGSSRGGLSAFYVATRRPEVFGRAGCLSSSFWAGLDPVYGGTFPGGPLEGAPLVSEVRGLLGDRARRPRLWIDWGLVRTGGTQNSAIEAAATTRGREMVALLRDRFGYAEGTELRWQEDPQGAHDEASWARRLPAVLTALLAGR